jgi:hypothetical protein
MMRVSLIAVTGFLVCGTIAGCKKPLDAAPAGSASAAVTAAPTATPQAGIPTSEDFEQPALDEINPQNMEQELEKLEKDIGK